MTTTSRTSGRTSSRRPTPTGRAHHEELALGAIGGQYQERLSELGELRATARHFEEGVVFHVAGEAYTSVFVSVDADAAGEGPAIIDPCRDYLEGRSAGDRRLMRGAR